MHAFHAVVQNIGDFVVAGEQFDILDRVFFVFALFRYAVTYAGKGIGGHYSLRYRDITDGGAIRFTEGILGQGAVLAETHAVVSAGSGYIIAAGIAGGSIGGDVAELRPVIDHADGRFVFIGQIIIENGCGIIFAAYETAVIDFVEINEHARIGDTGAGALYSPEYVSVVALVLQVSRQGFKVFDFFNGGNVKAAGIDIGLIYEVAVFDAHILVCGNKGDFAIHSGCSPDRIPVFRTQLSGRTESPAAIRHSVSS